MWTGLRKEKKKTPLITPPPPPPFNQKHPYRQRGELVAAQVQRLQLSPLVDAEGQF